LKNERKHILILALFQLIIFIIPSVIKDTHHHSFGNKYSSSLIGKSLLKGEKPCKICQFEFVNFISKDVEPNGIWQPITFLFNINFTDPENKISFYSFLHRAPPVS